MNKLKPLIASLIVLSMPGLAVADKAMPQNGFAFTGVGIGSTQYLGVHLATPPAPVVIKPSIDGGTTPPICNVDIQVLGKDAPSDTNPAQIINKDIEPGTTVFVPIVTDPAVPVANSVEPNPTDPVISPAAEPQYFKVSVKINTPTLTPGKDKKNMICAGLTGTMGVYDKVTQNLQTVIPMLSAPLK